MIPYVEKNYRVIADRGQRAIGGLTLAPNLLLGTALDHLDLFSYVVVTSNGLGADRRAAFEQQYGKVLNTPEGRKKIKLFWVGSGVNDRGNAGSKLLVEVMKQYGINVVYRESSGGHAQPNFRLYLSEFAPLLFR
jgi:enterochelin esterase family protein